MAAQTWDVTLLYTPPAPQTWDVTLLDGTAAGYGNTISAGFDDGAVEAAGEVVWYSIAVTVLETGATRPFLAPLDLSQVTAPFDLAHVLAPLDVGNVLAPLDVTNVLAPLDMETETA